LFAAVFRYEYISPAAIDGRPAIFFLQRVAEWQARLTVAANSACSQINHKNQSFSVIIAQMVEGRWIGNRGWATTAVTGE
jgi:hypothetical protein